MATRDLNQRTFSVEIGGLFSVPKILENKPEKAPYFVKRSLAELLARTKFVSNIQSFTDANVKNGWDFGDYISGSDELNYASYYWQNPLIFDYKLSKGDKYHTTDDDPRESIVEIDIESTIIYNGMFFLIFIEPGQFSGFSGWEAPMIIRDSFVSVLSDNEDFRPTIVPPCVMPVSLMIDISTADEQSFSSSHEKIKYIGTTKTDDSSGCTIKYLAKNGAIGNPGVMVKVFRDFYFNLDSQLASYYTMQNRSNQIESQHQDILSNYSHACLYLKQYLDTPSWNIIAKSRFSSILVRNVAEIQVNLVVCQH